jgi:predicted DNA-binding transcriptional regulator YafY
MLHVETMPRKDSTTTITRQWEILKLIPAHGCGITASSLTAKLRDERGINVTKRTVERDLESLSGLFPLECNAAQMPWGWKWLKGASLGISGLDVCDAVSLLTARDVLTKLLPAAMLETLEGKFAEAENKLVTLDGGLSKWPDLVRYVSPSFSFKPPMVDPDVLSKVQTALIEETQVEVEYHACDSEAKTLTLNPIALVHRGPVIYLVATAFEYEDVRLYAVHRIAKAVKMADAAICPKRFSLAGYLEEGAMDFCSSEPVMFVAEVSEALGGYLMESPMNDSQKMSRGDNGGWLLKATVRDSWQLRWWILSQGDGIVVREPEKLRVEIVNSINNACSGYGTDMR